MAFTHTAFPKTNSALSIERYGKENATRPWQVVAGYLETLFAPYLPLITFNTTVERVEKINDEWTITLRKSNQTYHGQLQDFWWQEKFDAVVVATGHYSVPYVPPIQGLSETFKAFPEKFEHSKQWRSAENYVNKKVVVVGGNVSAGDLVSDLHNIVSAPLYLSQRGTNEMWEPAFELPNVDRRPRVQSFSPANGGTITFADGTTVSDFDKVIFGTGYRLSYPFLVPDPVTPKNRLSGFYQHVFKIGDPTLAVIGQVRAAISFRVFEYQAVAAARVLAGRAKLPATAIQRLWEEERLKERGDTTTFHDVKPDFAEYFGYLRFIAGATPYELPAWRDEWEILGFAVAQAKQAWWKKVKEWHDWKDEKARKEKEQVKARL